jgi:hypothetical protein
MLLQANDDIPANSPGSTSTATATVHMPVNVPCTGERQRGIDAKPVIQAIEPTGHPPTGTVASVLKFSGSLEELVEVCGRADAGAIVDLGGESVQVRLDCCLHARSQPYKQSDTLPFSPRSDMLCAFKLFCTFTRLR